jgi:hypothetical protein
VGSSSTKQPVVAENARISAIDFQIAPRMTDASAFLAPTAGKAALQDQELKATPALAMLAGT